MAARVNSFFLLAALLPLIGASAAVAAGNGDAGKVRLALYYESLCPFSASFVVENLTRVFKDGLLEAADLTLVPYGNAEVGADRSISCQVCHRPGAAPPIGSSALLSFFSLPVGTWVRGCVVLELIADAVELYRIFLGRSLVNCLLFGGT